VTTIFSNVLKQNKNTGFSGSPRSARDDEWETRHCEEQSDVAIHTFIRVSLSDENKL